MPKASESKEWERRFLSLFNSCMIYTFGKDARKHPRHLQSYDLKKTKGTKIRIQKGRVNKSNVYYNPTWMKTYMDEKGIFNPCDIIDVILLYLTKIKEGRNGSKG